MCGDPPLQWATAKNVIHTSSAFEYSKVISNHTCISLTAGSKTPDLSYLSGKRNQTLLLHKNRWKRKKTDNHPPLPISIISPPILSIFLTLGVKHWARTLTYSNSWDSGNASILRMVWISPICFEWKHCNQYLTTANITAAVHRRLAWVLRLQKWFGCFSDLV